MSRLHPYAEKAANRALALYGGGWDQSVRDDMRQEVLVALWQAQQRGVCFDDARGRGYARQVAGAVAVDWGHWWRHALSGPKNNHHKMPTTKTVDAASRYTPQTGEQSSGEWLPCPYGTPHDLAERQHEVLEVRAAVERAAATMTPRKRDIALAIFLREYKPREAQDLVGGGGTAREAQDVGTRLRSMLRKDPAIAALRRAGGTDD